MKHKMMSRVGIVVDHWTEENDYLSTFGEFDGECAIEDCEEKVIFTFSSEQNCPTCGSQVHYCKKHLNQITTELNKIFENV